MFLGNRVRAGLGLLAAVLSAAAGEASPATLTLDPERTRIQIDVDSTLHLVEGRAQLVTGEVRFDTEGGAASGRLEIDARSVETGNGLRDGTMHEDVLESERFPLITFTPESLDVTRVEAGQATARLSGQLQMHGAERPLTIPVELRGEGDQLELEAGFPLRYVEWGMQNPGNFLLSVDDVVNVRIEATVRIAPPLP